MDDMSDARTLGGGAGAREKWSLTEGATLGGYRVVKPLGRGGMGEVYLAENVLTGKRYALKLLPPELARDSSFRGRFAREAAVLQELRHEGIVQVLHAAEEDGRFFLTMDYVDGGSLDDRLKAEGKLAEDETARIALELCDALAYAHGKGVIHRDIKPANVLLEKEGRAKVSDFGLARVVGDDFLKSMTQRSISLSMARTDGGGLSQSDNAVIGTYEYMSPEQMAGQPADERSDVFSLGLMIYRMLTGERPVGVFSMPSELGLMAEWDGVVRGCLEPKRELRLTGADALAQGLRALDVGALSAMLAASPAPEPKPVVSLPPSQSDALESLLRALESPAREGAAPPAPSGAKTPSAPRAIEPGSKPVSAPTRPTILTVGLIVDWILLVGFIVYLAIESFTAAISYNDLGGMVAILLLLGLLDLACWRMKMLALSCRAWVCAIVIVGVLLETPRIGQKSLHVLLSHALLFLHATALLVGIGLARQRIKSSRAANVD